MIVGGIQDEERKEFDIFKKSFHEINNLLIAYASGKYYKRGRISQQLHSTDSVISGINMLGEELQYSTISRDYFLSIFNTVPDMIFVLNGRGEIINCNESVFSNLDLAQRDASLKFKDIVSDPEFSFQHMKERLKDSEHCTLELALKDHKNNEIPVWCNCTKIQSKGTQYDYLVVAHNISYQKESEQKILKAIVETQEREQKRVAEDLHDSLGQELSALKLFLSSLELSIGDENKELLHQCNDLLNESIQNLRNICFNLTPGTIELSGINESIISLITKINQQHLIQIHFNPLKTTVNLKKDIDLALYRITQEFINNSIKHAYPKNIYIDLSFQKRLILKLRDDGEGFDTSQLAKISGNGIRNMSSRAVALNGKFEIKSEAGKGTQVIVRIPVNNEKG